MRVAAVTAGSVRGRAWIPFLVGFGLLWGVLSLVGSIDATPRLGVLVLVSVVATAIAVNALVYRLPVGEALRLIGLGRPAPRPLVVAVLVSCLVLLVFPLATAVTGAQLGLVEQWPLFLVGLFAFNGLAEEVVWRGFAFRRLREGRSFIGAVLWTMPLVVAAHVPIMVSSGPVVGLGAMLVAAVTSFPLGYLYEVSGSTVWAAALLHTAIDSFKIVVVPPGAVFTFSLLLIGVSLLVPLVALVVPRRVLEDRRDAWQPGR